MSENADTTAVVATCSEWVPDDFGSGFHSCPNKAKPGKDLCGVHEGAKNRRETKAETEKAERIRNAELSAEGRKMADEAIAALAEHGVSAQAVWTAKISGYDGTIKVNGASLLALLNTLEG